MILTINQIIKRFRTGGQCYKFKPQTIVYMANKLGYTKKQFGGKIGYDQSLITAITRHFNEAVKYDEGLGMEVPQKSRKQPIMGDYYTYNGEKDNIDYDWEKNENKNMNNKLIRLTEGDLHNIVKESVKRILNEIGDTPRGQYMLGRLTGKYGGSDFFHNYNIYDGNWGEDGDYSDEARDLDDDLEFLKANDIYQYSRKGNYPHFGYNTKDEAFSCGMEDQLADDDNKEYFKYKELKKGNKKPSIKFYSGKKYDVPRVSDSPLRRKYNLYKDGIHYMPDNYPSRT